MARPKKAKAIAAAAQRRQNEQGQSSQHPPPKPPKPQKQQKLPNQHNPSNHQVGKPKSNPRPSKKQRLKNSAVRDADPPTGMRPPPYHPPPNLPPRPRSPSPRREPPRGPREDSHMYRFGEGGETYRPSHPPGRENYRPSYSQPSSRDERLPPRDSNERIHFTFRSDQPAPRFPSDGGHGPNRNGARHDGRQAVNRRRPYQRPQWKPPPTHDRAIFRALTKRQGTPERLQGMADGTVRFKSVGELSQSMSEDSDDSLPHKRQKVDEPELPEKPKWSNPDPYTALPPTFEPRAKRTDVVQLIRKAKVALETSDAANNAIADNDDFVPLSFGSDDENDVPNSLRTDHLQNPLAGASSSAPIVISSYSTQAGVGAGTLPPPLPGDDDSSHSRKRKRALAGAIAPEWISSATLATPWITKPYTPTDDGFWRLHQEISDFYHFVKPQPPEQRVRQYLVNRVHTVLSRRFFDHRVLAFGSFASGLYLPLGDMDLVLVSRSYEERNVSTMRRLTNKTMRPILEDLIYARIARREGSTIVSKAKVPILKFSEEQTGLKVDISFENLSGVVANRTYTEWLSQFPDLPYLVSIVKQFLLMRGLNEVFMGGLGGFSITCLVVNFLQQETGIQSASSEPARNLGQLLVDFLDFYGRKFDMRRKVISLRPPAYLEKAPKIRAGIPMFEEKWSILDPNRSDNDISVGTSSAPLIARCFAEAADCLRESIKLVMASKVDDVRHSRSILGCILGGNYSSFMKQRDHMRSLDDYYASTAR